MGAGEDSCEGALCDGAASCEPAAPEPDGADSWLGADSDWPEPEPLPDAFGAEGLDSDGAEPLASLSFDDWGACEGDCSGWSWRCPDSFSPLVARGVALVPVLPEVVLLALTVRPGNAFAATPVSAPVRAVVPASSQRFARVSLKSAASRVVGV